MSCVTVGDSMLKTLAKTCHICLHKQYLRLLIMCQVLEGAAFGFRLFPTTSVT